MAVFVRGGSIITIKLHYKKLSLLRAFLMPIRLDVYLDSFGRAEGLLYFDDGSSFNYQAPVNQRLLIKYTYEN